MEKNYINLTNGIEAIPLLNNYSFIRIQSTACEQHLWSKILLELDYDFLMNVAIGNECIIYDYGANKATPRSVYQGIEFVKYALYKIWYKQSYEPIIKRGGKSAFNCKDYFDSIHISEEAEKKLKYFIPFLSGTGINITCKTASTKFDNNKAFYVGIINQRQELENCAYN